MLTTPRRANMSSESSSVASTVHYAKPVIHRHPTTSAGGTPSSIGSSSSGSSSLSSSKQTPPRSPVIRYPTVVVGNNSAVSTPSSIITPQGTPSYAVPVARNQLQYSASKLQYEHMKHRCKMLDDENQKLMRMQSDVVNDANRRVQMHVNEIRMLKDENRKLTTSNKELRDLCCFLDDDRQKTRKLAREWQKFGRYTSNLMKQEVHSYHQKMGNIEEKLSTKEREVDELRQLCMYLDEQRQSLMTGAHHIDDGDNESEDLGCGSSEQSGGSEGHQEEEKHADAIFQKCFNKHKEHTLRRIMATSMCSEPSEEEERREVSKRERSRLLGYIQSLENRIKHLEMSQNHESFWNSSSNVGSECDEKTIIERGWMNDEMSSDGGILEEKQQPMSTSSASSSHIVGEKLNMFDSMTSTMTSSGCTTYASSGTDGESVFVMGDEIGFAADIGNLEVRTLSRIEEEHISTSDSLRESARMPPKIAPPICSSLVLTNFDLSDDDSSPKLQRSASETCRPTTSLISSLTTLRSVSVEKNNNINISLQH
ncbi:unnamed protein product [Caenorhabditis sp. 36 PRJEB53466]|nr:unnamed protein product [Caenorhabditis sp. 36 PRJEB53466]